MIGRGGRVFDGKGFFTVLDYGANGSRFGRWDMDRDWSEMWQGKTREKSGVAPAKLCPKCLAINAIHATECVECGHKFPGSRRAKVEETQLVELSGGITGRMLSSLSASELHAWGRTSKNPHYAARVARTKGAAFLGEFAAVAGYKQGWIVRQLGEERGFKDRRV
jgi:ribosomal protein L40E